MLSTEINTQGSLNKLGDRLNDLEDSADEFSIVAIQDHAVRFVYKSKIHQLAESIFNSVKSGEMTAESGANHGEYLRNRILEAARQETTLLCRSLAEYVKEHGVKNYEVLERYARQDHGKYFSDLTSNQRHDVYLKVIASAEQTKTKFENWSAKTAFLARGVLAFALAHSTKFILESRTRTDALIDEATTTFSAILGVGAGKDAARLIAGPGAPIFVGAGIFLGSMVSADKAYRYFERNLT
jgi:hypothetical protein